MPNADEEHMKCVNILIRILKQHWNEIQYQKELLQSEFKQNLGKCPSYNMHYNMHTIHYAPKKNAEYIEKIFYDLLDRILVNVNRSDIVLMIEDFNVEVGYNNQDIEHIMGHIAPSVIKKMKMETY